MKTESLPVQLTEDEIRDFGQRSAREVKEILELKDEAKSTAAELKAQIKEKESELQRLAHCINSGREFRPVEIIENIDRERSRAVITRADTGEFVRYRSLEPSEMQTSLDSMF